MDQATSQRFKYWQTRTIIATMIGYALFYFVRKNLSIAMPAMQADLGITMTELGLFLTLHGLIYGLSKFINGFIGDRVNALSLHRGRVGCNRMRVCGLAGLEVVLFRTFHYRSAGCGRCVVYHERYPAVGWSAGTGSRRSYQRGGRTRGMRKQMDMELNNLEQWNLQ